MPYIKNINNSTITLNIPITDSSVVLAPNEVSRLLTEEEILSEEVQSAYSSRAIAILEEAPETAYVCSWLTYKGLVNATEDFPENPVQGWLVVANQECLTPDAQLLYKDSVAMFTGTNWLVFQGGGIVATHNALTERDAANTHPATSVSYSNTLSGLTATQVQAALDEAITRITTHSGLTTAAHGGIVASNDTRLTNARTPTSHASSHVSGGLDAIKLDDFSAPDDNTDLNASTSKHGLMQKYPGGTTDFLRADGSFATPPATPYTLPTASDTVLGGVKVGTNLSIDGSGVLSATSGGVGDMTKIVYDTNDDGTVNSSDEATAVTGVDSAGNSKYYGTDSGGTPGFHTLTTGSLTGYPDPVDFNTSDVGVPLVADVASYGGVDASTKLMLHFNGANTSTTFTDSSASAHTITPSGSAQVSTAQSVFGGTSVLLNGTTDYLTIPNSADFDLGSGDFCIDFRIRMTNVSTENVILAKWGASGSNLSFKLSYLSAGTVQFSYTTDGSTVVNKTWSSTLVTGQWHHVAVVRDGTNLRLFRNGNSIGSTSIGTATIYTGTNPVTLGYHDTAAAFLDGYIDELRLSKGTPRVYTTTDPLYATGGDPSNGFTVPIQAYSQVGAKSVTKAYWQVKFPAAISEAKIALVDDVTIATNAARANIFTVTLTGSRTLGLPTNLQTGRYTWIIRQDGVGNKTLAYDAIFRFPGGIAPVLSTGANAIDMLTAYYDGSRLLCEPLLKGYVA